MIVYAKIEFCGGGGGGGVGGGGWQANRVSYVILK